MNVVKKLIHKFLLYKAFIGLKDRVVYLFLFNVRLFFLYPLRFINPYLHMCAVYRLFSYFFRDSYIRFCGKVFQIQQGGDFLIIVGEEGLEKYVPRKGNVFIDVGAHIGKYSIIFEDRFKKIIAIEPDPQNYKYLLRNIKLNKLEGKINPIKMAISDKNGQIILNRAKFNYGGHTIQSLDKKDIFLYRDSILVKSMTLDSLIRKLNLHPSQIDFIKIDVEGAENKVFREASNLLMQGKPIIVFEVLSHNKHNLDQIQKVLTRFQYKVRQLSEDYYLAFVSNE